MPTVHPILNDLKKIAGLTHDLTGNGQIFRAICEQIRSTWLHRPPDRWPSSKNWVLRVAPEYTAHPSQRLEKQLQKQIAISLEHKGWGNDVPTASGLVDCGGRQMNVDLAHRINGGFELIELKIESNTPNEAAFQVLRYAAIYLLYRTEPELVSRFRNFQMMRASRIVLEVLAPLSYYNGKVRELGPLEQTLDAQVNRYAASVIPGLEMRFRFTAFPAAFKYAPGMNSEQICGAVEGRARLVPQC